MLGVGEEGKVYLGVPSGINEEVRMIKPPCMRIKSSLRIKILYLKGRTIIKTKLYRKMNVNINSSSRKFKIKLAQLLPNANYPDRTCSLLSPPNRGVFPHQFKRS